MTLDSFNAFTVTGTPQSVLWKLFHGVIVFLIVCKHFGPRSNPTSIGSSLCPNCLWECFVVAAKVVATYSMGRSWIHSWLNSLEPYQAQLYVGC